ncbi:hypothetical protein V8E55_009798 [Tylopilus felleus]
MKLGGRIDISIVFLCIVTAQDERVHTFNVSLTVYTLLKKTTRGARKVTTVKEEKLVKVKELPFAIKKIDITRTTHSCKNRRNIHMALLPQFLLKLVKIDGIVLLDHIANKNDIFLAEDVRTSNGTEIGIRVGDGAKFFVELECIVSKRFLDTKDTADVFDGAALFIKNEDLVFCVVGDSVYYPWVAAQVWNTDTCDTHTPGTRSGGGGGGGMWGRNITLSLSLLWYEGWCWDVASQWWLWHVGV